MTVHVRRSLEERQEGPLSPEHESAVRDHLRTCDQCSAYAQELDRNDQLLAQPRSTPALPPLRVERSLTFGSAALPIFATGFAVVLAVLFGSALAERRAAAPGPSATPVPTSAPPVARTDDMLVFWDRATGHLVMADAERRERARHQPVAPISQLPVADPTGHRVAYWAQTGGQSGSQELVTWEPLTGAVRKVASSGDLIPWGRPTWSSDGELLAYAIATSPTGRDPEAPPRRSQLVVADGRANAVRTVISSSDRFPIVPITVERSIVTGTQAVSDGARYVVVDVDSRIVRSSVPAARFRDVGTAAAGVSWGLAKTFESTSPATLRVWPTGDYASPLVTLEREVAPPVAWPGRSELVLGTVDGSPGPGSPIDGLDLRSGRTRALVVMPSPVVPLAFTSDGAYLFVLLPATQEFRFISVQGDRLGGPIIGYIPVFTPSSASFVGFVH